MGQSISIISDIHIKRCHDGPYMLLISFFNHPIVKSSDAIYLLGDIFDLMIGRHRGYWESYKDYFYFLGEFLKEGKEIHYFEGNHDLHIESNYRDYFHHHQISDDGFIYHDRPLVKEIWGKTFFFAHGDEIQIGNRGYKIYKSILCNPVTKFFLENIIGHGILQYSGELASKLSGKRSRQSDPNLVRDHFRLAAKKQAMEGYDYIICGHSHVQDDYVCKGEGLPHFTYLNNGYAVDSKTFIHLCEGRHSFVHL